MAEVHGVHFLGYVDGRGKLTGFVHRRWAKSSSWEFELRVGSRWPSAGFKIQDFKIAKTPTVKHGRVFQVEVESLS